MAPCQTLVESTHDMVDDVLEIIMHELVGTSFRRLAAHGTVQVRELLIDKLEKLNNHIHITVRLVNRNYAIDSIAGIHGKKMYSYQNIIINFLLQLTAPRVHPQPLLH